VQKQMSAKGQKPTSERQRGFAYYSHRSPAVFPTMQVWFNIASFRLVCRDVCDVIAVPTQAGTAKYYNDCLVNKQITAHIIAKR
jgi:hypothetical protein